MNGWSGLFRASVTDNADPEGRLRLRLVVPEFGTKPLATWVPGCLPASSSAVPPIGAQVWVLFEKGDRDYPVWVGTVPGAVPSAEGSDDAEVLLWTGAAG